MDRAEHVHQQFLNRVVQGDFPVRPPDSNPPKLNLSKPEAFEIFRSQCISRHLDRMGRKMQKEGHGYYTIGSSGHEGMAAVAASLRPTDMAFLHYRDAAFQIQRASQIPDQSPIKDMLLSFTCSSEDPISGGRHKVLGSKTLAIPPQTSTIASHLPKAVGAALSIGLAGKIKPEHQVMENDGICMCSFGDASTNHSTALGAFNTASWTSYRNMPMPLMFVCEDNGIGISVPTPDGWIAANFVAREGLKYFNCDGLDIFDTYAKSKEAAEWIRKTRKPAFVHMRTVRLYGHAGSDVETTYRSRASIEEGEANDPLLHSARLLIEHEYATSDEVLSYYNQVENECENEREKAAAKPRLKTSEEVMASLVPPLRKCVKTKQASENKRKELFGSEFANLDQPQTMAKLINWALTDLMAEHGEIILAGEDIGKKGGVYGVTQKLQARFGQGHVIDTVLDEQSILGLSIGLGHNGFVPIPEIQFLAYLHNAEDQLRGEAATLPFFSDGQFTNPMVIRIAGLGYQKGFGGHFHNDNSLAVIRDIPGIIIACPSNGADAAKMLRECVRLAREKQRVVVFVEPIALYQTRDLHGAKDNQWLSKYPELDEKIDIGEIGISGEGKDLAIISYANGHFLSMQAAKTLLDEHNIETTNIDLRWLAPLPEEEILNAIKACKHVLIVDECRRTGSQSEGLMSLLSENGVENFSRITAYDSFIATGPAYAATLPSCDRIVEAALVLAKKI